MQAHPIRPVPPVKRRQGRPSAHRPARICTRISQAAADHIRAHQRQHRLSLAQTIEALTAHLVQNPPP